MLNRFRRFIRKFPGISFLLFAGLIAFSLQHFYSEDASTLMLRVVAVVGFVQVLHAIQKTWRHGFYGIHLIPAAGIVTALFTHQLWVAFVLAVVVAIERPMLCVLQRGRTKDSVKASNLSAVQHAPFIRKLDGLSVLYILSVILFGGALWVTSEDAVRFLSVISAASTAPLLLAGPAAYIIGIKKAGRRNIIFTNATAFEKLAGTKTLIMYATGIVTKHEYSVNNVRPFKKKPKTEVLQIAASLASQSEHVLSRAIVSAAGGELKITRAKHTKEIIHEGISGRIQGKSLCIGRLDFLTKNGVEIPDTLKEPEDTAVYVGENSDLIGVITFENQRLSGIKKALDKIRRLGIKSIHLVSGSGDGAVKKLAKNLGIDAYTGNAYPGDIVSLIQTSQHKNVAVVANGQTDSASLTAADVGITTDELLPGISDVALLEYRPDSISAALRLTKVSHKIARLLLMTGLWFTLVLLIVAASGKLAPIYIALCNLAIAIVLMLLPAVLIRAKD